MITNRRSQKKFNNQNGVNRSPLYDLSVYDGVLSWEKIKMSKSKLLEKGQKFGELVIIKLHHKKQYIDKKGVIRNREYYLCQCDCGNIKVIEKSQLTTGHTKSCGCLQKKITSKKHKTHGLSKNKIYFIWCSMKDRCYRQNSNDYLNYGGRGITICDEWKNDFKTFYQWAINNGYKEGLTIERINVNDNYKPSNCTWIENALQSKNKTNSHYLTYNDKTQIIEDWAKEMKLNNGATISGRLKRGWSIEEALTTPLGQKRKSSITE